MKPIDRFSYLKNNRVSQDTSSLVQCYLPIIGQEALSLYLYTISFWDNGRKEYLFSSILNHLNFGMDRLLKSLKILSAFNLLTLYQKGDTYQIVIHAPLSIQDFLEHPVYRRLLEKKIGDAAVEDLKGESAEGEEIPVSLNQVFPDLAELGNQEDLVLKKKVANDFDLDHFRQLMSRDGLRFADEQSDVLNLFAIAEEKKWTWFETYQWLSQQLFPRSFQPNACGKKLLKNLFPLTLVLRKRPLSRKPKVKRPCSSWQKSSKHARGPSPKQKENSCNRWLAWACWTKSSISFSY